MTDKQRRKPWQGAQQQADCEEKPDPSDIHGASGDLMRCERLGLAVHRLSGWGSPMPDRAAMDFDIVRQSARVVPLRIVKERLKY